MALISPDKRELQGVAKELEEALDELEENASCIELEGRSGVGFIDRSKLYQHIRELFAEETPLKMKRAMLVYQNGLANVFAVECFNLVNCSRNARRLIQADFRTCEAFAHGLGVAGVTVRTAVCNQSGDIIDAQWTTDLDTQPLANGFRPIYMHQGEHV